MIRHHIVYIFDSALLGAIADSTVAIFAIMVWVVYLRQLRTMNAALEESRRNNQAIEETNKALLEEARKANSATLEETQRSNAATDRSNEIADRALIYGKRSWLIPEIDERSPFKEEGGSVWKVAFYISNTGSVPGVMINAHARVDTDPQFESSNPQMFDTNGAVILPGAVGDRGMRVKAEVPAEIPEGQVLGTTGPSICVYCSIRYKDVFSDEWESKVAWMRGKDGWYHYSRFDIKIK
jgi:hypothetical protein